MTRETVVAIPAVNPSHDVTVGVQVKVPSTLNQIPFGGTLVYAKSALAQDIQIKALSADSTGRCLMGKFFLTAA
jgi:hypothetical protein